MQSLTSNPTVVVYAISAIVLCLNMLFLWAYSGAVRAKTKTVLNTEDASTTSKGADIVETDPPAVARVLRAHRNAEANIYPFLFLALVYVMVGGTDMFAKITFGIFTAARLIHSVVYLNGKQPWRSLMFAIGIVVSVVIAGDIVYLLVK
jgi:prostaglandin-E synthase 1